MSGSSRTAARPDVADPASDKPTIRPFAPEVGILHPGARSTSRTSRKIPICKFRTYKNGVKFLPFSKSNRNFRVKRTFFRCFGFALALVLWQIPSASGEEGQLALRNIFEKARNIANIKAIGMPGFRLLGDVRIGVKKDTTSQGKYLFVWTPEGKWKEEIVFKGYRRVRSGDGKQFWQVRSSEIENPLIFGLDLLLKVRRPSKIEEGDKLKRLHSEKIEGTDANCIRHVSGKGYTQTFCFNAHSGELLRYTPDKTSDPVSWVIVWEEYSQFQQWAGKSFPRTLRGFNGKQKVIEVQFDEIKPLPQLPADFFTPPKDATVWIDCADGEAWKAVKQEQPVYPQSGRLLGTEGTVIIYAVIEENGHLSNLHFAHSTGTELDQAAGNAVSQWLYERTTGCKDSRGRTETVIRVVFSLQR